MDNPRTPPASEPIPEVAGNMVMWAKVIRTEGIYPGMAADLDQAAALLSAQAVMLEEARKAMRDIKPYLEWTVSDESPGHHPTMPSAVGAFLDAFAKLEASHVG